MRPSNPFSNPQRNYLDTVSDALSYQFSIGHRVWPTIPVSSQSETYFMLRKACDQSKYGDLNIDQISWCTDAFALACDHEKAVGSMEKPGYSGVNARSAEPLMFGLRHFPNTRVAAAYIMLCHDVIVEITATKSTT